MRTGAGMVGSDRPRDFQGPVGARLADLQIQRDVDRLNAPSRSTNCWRSARLSVGTRAGKSRSTVSSPIFACQVPHRRLVLRLARRSVAAEDLVQPVDGRQPSPQPIGYLRNGRSTMRGDGQPRYTFQIAPTTLFLFHPTVWAAASATTDEVLSCPRGSTPTIGLFFSVAPRISFLIHLL